VTDLQPAVRENRLARLDPLTQRSPNCAPRITRNPRPFPQGICGYVSVMATLKFTYYRIKGRMFLCLWFRASLIYINNCPTRCNTKQSVYYSASSLYVFRVSTTPIIRSTQNCNYSLRHWSYFLCSYLPPTWPSFPLSGVHKTVTTDSVTGHNFCAATSRQRGRDSHYQEYTKL